GGAAVAVAAGDQLSNRLAAVDEVLEEASDHRRLRLIDLEPGRALMTTPHPAVAVGHQPKGDLTGPGTVQLPPPVALGDLGAFVLGDDALHLMQEPGLRVVKRRRVEEGDLHPIPAPPPPRP